MERHCLAYTQRPSKILGPMFGFDLSIPSCGVATFLTESFCDYSDTLLTCLSCQIPLDLVVSCEIIDGDLMIL